MRHGLARVVHDNDRDIGRIGKVELAFSHNELCTSVDRVLRKRMPVDLQTDDAEEHVTWLDRITAVGQAGYLFGTASDDCALKSLEQLRACRHELSPRSVMLYRFIASSIIS